ncbi:MAG: hypothetical protein MUO97_03380, partial [Dehalococcoidia bacterium]|nr:hypothetical protein [Dehalococcoidia bacterium]
MKYIYALATSPSNLYRFKIADNAWSASLLTWPDTTTQGSGMVWTGGDSIYVLAGGGTSPNPFRRYTISTNTTTAMTGAPQKANSGSGLAYDGGDTIYALLTSSSSPAASWLYAYSISSGGWTFLDNAPEQMSSGSSICRVGSYLYIGGGIYVAGVSPTRYWRWSTSKKWENLAPLPDYVWGSGSGQEKVSTTFIYATKGGEGATTNNFMQYSIPDNKWTYMPDTPGNVKNQGDRLAYDGTFLYMIRGWTDSSFWRYRVTVTGYNMEIRENINGIPSADTQTLQMRYKLANTNDNFKVQVWNGTAWSDRGAVLSSTSWENWSYVLLSSEVISGKVQVKFVDVNASSTVQDNLLVDYLRVRSYSASWSTSVVMKLRTGSDNNPYPNDTENWSGWCVHDNNTENTSMPNNRYVQYRVELSTTNENKTPVLLSGSVVINYTPGGFTFRLWAGWNMISFPVMPDNKDPHSIFPGDYTMFKWNAAGKQYVLCTDDNIENGVGYWVYVSAAENVVVSGTPVDSLALPLSAGWNLIGSPLGGASIASPDDTPDGSVLPYAFT